jgi:Rrf2 family protein
LHLVERRMRFTSQVRYAVLAVFDMAYHDAGVPHQAKTVSRRQRIPPRYLEQIFQRLVRDGILQSKRGPKGGYRLARPAGRLTIGDIVRATEGSVEELLSGRTPGSAQPGSNRSQPSQEAAPGPDAVWATVVGRVSEVLETVTIADLVAAAEKLGLERDADGNMYFI